MKVTVTQKGVLGVNSVDTALKTAIEHEFMKAQDSLNKSVKNLLRLGVELSNPETLKAVSPEWLREYITKGKEKFLSSSPFIPSDLRKEIEEKYEKVYKEALPDASNIEGVLSRYPFTLRATGKAYEPFLFDEVEVDKETTKRATYTFDEAQKEYYSLLVNLGDTLNSLSEWEEAHHYLNFAVGGTISNLGNGVALREHFQDFFTNRDRKKVEVDRDTFLKLLKSGSIGEPQFK